MALDANGVTFLLHALSQGVRYDRTATLGRQRLLLRRRTLQACLKRFGFAPDFHAGGFDASVYAEPLLRTLGATTTRSFDASAYEGATDLHDFNTPITSGLSQQFTAVIDGGTLEHIFNFPVAIANAMEMVEEGGHYLALSPTNNLAGHGFYQLSAELYFRVLAPENGFRVMSILLYDDRVRPRWFEVADPRVLRRRVLLTNSRSTRLAVLAQRIATKPIFSVPPTQSDYEVAWTMGESSPRRVRYLLNTLWRLLPGSWRQALRPDRDAYRRIHLSGRRVS